MQVIGNAFMYVSAKQYQNRERFDKAITKIKWCSYLRQMTVVNTVSIIQAHTIRESYFSQHICYHQLTATISSVTTLPLS